MRTEDREPVEEERDRGEINGMKSNLILCVYSLLKAWESRTLVETGADMWEMTVKTWECDEILCVELSVFLHVGNIRDSEVWDSAWEGTETFLHFYRSERNYLSFK